MRPPFTCLYREIWDDEEFYSMSEIGRLVYLFLLSAPMGNGLGCFRAGRAAMAEESRLLTKRFQQGFAEGLKVGLFEYDEEKRVLLIPKYFERNPPANPNGIKALSKEFVRIPECELKAKCYLIVAGWVAKQKESFAEPFNELFVEPLAEPICARTCARSPSPSPSPSLSPSVSSKEDIDPPKNPSRAAEFETFYSAYPKKVGRIAAEKAWEKAAKNGLPPIEDILKAIEAQCKSKQWSDEQFIPHPATWLSKGRWADELETSKLSTEGMTLEELWGYAPPNETPAEAQHRRSKEALMRLGEDDPEDD